MPPARYRRNRICYLTPKPQKTQHRSTLIGAGLQLRPSKIVKVRNKQFLYAPRQPPTLVRLLREDTLLIFSLRCFASTVLMLTPWVGPSARGTLGGARCARARTGGRARGARGPRGPFGPPGKGAFGALGTHGGRWDDSEAFPNVVKAKRLKD